jgi:hypothetical protein
MFLSTLDRRFICLNVKVDKEAQITGEEPTPKPRRTFGSDTVSENGELRVV